MQARHAPTATWDQQEQAELEALEDQGTELLIEFEMNLFLIMGFYAQWMLACQHNFCPLMIGFQISILSLQMHSLIL